MKLTSKAARARTDLGPAPVVVLSRPQLGENVGQVARAMLNFGLHELRLVSPRFGWPNAKAVAASAGAYEVLNRVRIFERLEDAVADLHHLVATTARRRELDKPTADAAETARLVRGWIGGGRRAGLLFGGERSGLANDELALADLILHVPLNPQFSSLNLAQAVLLCGYEWFRATASPAESGIPTTEPPATKGELAAFLDYLVDALDRSAFFRSPTRRESLVRAIRVMVERWSPTTPELNLLFGIVKQLAGTKPEEGGPRNYSKRISS